MRGDCASCGFPILVKNTKETVACPFCATVNQPVSGISISPVLIGLGVAIGIVLLAKVRS